MLTLAYALVYHSDYTQNDTLCRDDLVKLSGDSEGRVQMTHRQHRLQVAIYCRVSTDDQSCERQERDLTNYCAKLGYDVVGIYREIASGAKNDRAERAKVMKLAQTRKIDAIVVSELTRWGRSTMDLIGSLQDLQSKGVSLIAQTGMQLDLSTAQGKLMATILAGLAEFERDLIRERVKSGIASAKARGKRIGRQTGQTIKAHKVASQVMTMVKNGVSIRTIAKNLNISTGTVQKVIREGRKALSA